MADLNVFNGTGVVESPFVEYELNGQRYARGKIKIHNKHSFYSVPHLVVTGKLLDLMLSLEVGQGLRLHQVPLRSENRVLEQIIPVRTLNMMGQLVVQNKTMTRNYTDVFLYVDDKLNGNITVDNFVEPEDDINSFTFTGRICTLPQSKIIGNNKNSLSFVSASNFARKDMDTSYLYVVIEGKEAARLEGRLGTNSKFSGSAMLRTKVKPYVFEYEQTVVDEENSTDTQIRYTTEKCEKEIEIEQLEILFLDNINQLNFIDNIKNPDLAEQFGEV